MVTAASVVCRRRLRVRPGLLLRCVGSVRGSGKAGEQTRRAGHGLVRIDPAPALGLGRRGRASAAAGRGRSPTSGPGSARAGQVRTSMDGSLPP
jgi:hypothetical protein